MDDRQKLAAFAEAIQRACEGTEKPYLNDSRLHATLEAALRDIGQAVINMKIAGKGS